MASLYEYGGIGDGAETSTAADTAALHAAGHAGGEVFVPSGTWRIHGGQTALTAPPRTDRGLLIRGEGPSSRLVFSSPTPNSPDNLFTVRDFARLSIRDLAIVGGQTENDVDCDRLIYFSGARLHIAHVEIVGVRGKNGEALIDSLALDTVLDAVTFAGCTVIGGAHVRTDLGQLHARGCQFVDYGNLDGALVSKTGVGAAEAFLRAHESGNPEYGSRGPGTLLVEACRFDEGARWAVMTDPVPSGGRRHQRVVVLGCNALPAVGGGVLCLYGVNDVDVRGLRATCREENQRLVDLYGVRRAVVDGAVVTSPTGMNLYADEATGYLRITQPSPGLAWSSHAARTLIEVDGVVQ